MADGFHRIGRSLRADRGLKSTTALLIGLAIVAGWIFWAFKAHVTRYEVSDSARLELNASAYPVEANLSGRIVQSRLALGVPVEAGEVLVELDSSAERLSLAEEEARRANIGPQVKAIEAQITSEKAGHGDEVQVLDLSREGALAQYREAEAQANLAAAAAERASRLQQEGILAVADADRARAEAQSKRSAAEALRSAAARLGPELQVRDRSRDTRLKQIAGEEAKLQAEAGTSSATIKRLQYDIDRKTIRAPVSGRLGECAVLHEGAHISEGQQLGIILPNDQLHAVAEFNASTGMGRLHEGQIGTMQLQAFPWAQYGSISVHVARVASEVRDGKVRVELSVDPTQRLRMPIQHGLAGSIKVATERTTPLALLLESAGVLVADK